jgi:hypothetical protein
MPDAALAEVRGIPPAWDPCCAPGEDGETSKGRITQVSLGSWEVCIPTTAKEEEKRMRVGDRGADIDPLV